MTQIAQIKSLAKAIAFEISSILQTKACIY